MPVALLMPALSPTMTEGNIAKWIKKVGDEVVSGDIIAEVETDKATMEVEAIDEGKLASIIFPDGSENVQVNKLIGVIALQGDTEKDIEDFINKNTDIIADQSYSERQLFEKAYERLKSEFEAVLNISPEEVQKKMDKALGRTNISDNTE